MALYLHKLFYTPDYALLEQWLIQWKPGDMSVTFLVFLSFGMFWLRVWPWLTKEYFPARQQAAQQRLEIEARHEEAQQKVMQDISDALAEVKVLVAQNVNSTNVFLAYLATGKSKVTASDAAPKRTPRPKKIA